MIATYALVAALVALVVMLLVLAGLCLWAFSSIKSEVKRISLMEVNLEAFKVAVADVKMRIDQVEVDHYKRLEKRIEQHADALAGINTRVVKNEDNYDSLRGKFAAIKRWDKQPPPENPAAPAPPADEVDELLRRAAAQPPAPDPAEPGKPSHFGRRAV